MRRKENRSRTGTIATAIYAIVAIAGAGEALGTPQFARETQLPCSTCHSQIPRLNEFGERFYANKLHLKGRSLKNTYPGWVALAMSDSSDSTPGLKAPPGNKIDISYDRTLIGSGGYVPEVGLLYHLFVVPTVQSAQLYGIKDIGPNVSFAFGTMPAMSQIEYRTEMNTNVPVNVAPAGSGYGRFSPFAPAGTMDGVRLTVASKNAMPYSDGWKLAATVPFSNEVAGGGYGGPPIPFHESTEARGAYLELFQRKGMNSEGVGYYNGKDGRRYFGAMAQRKFGPLYVQGGVAYDQWPFGITHIASVTADYRVSFHQVYGMQVDDQDGVITYGPIASWVVGGDGAALSIVASSMLGGLHSRPMSTLLVQVRF